MIRYTVDRKHRLVTADILDCGNDVLNKMERQLKGISKSSRLIKAASIPDMFTATARCHPDDTFDEKIGKQLAKHRVLNKYHASKAKAFRRVEEVLEEIGDELPKKASVFLQNELKTIHKYNKD